MDSPAVILKELKVRRTGRILMYLGLSISGILTTLFPSRLVEDQVGGPVVLCWSLGMLVSALTCFYGAVTDKWIGEYTGIPLLASVLGLYGLSALAASDSHSLAILAYGLIVVSFASGLVARWRDLQVVKKAAEDTKEG